MHMFVLWSCIHLLLAEMRRNNSLTVLDELSETHQLNALSCTPWGPEWQAMSGGMKEAQMDTKNSREAGKNFLSFLFAYEANVYHSWVVKGNCLVVCRYKQTWQHSKSKQ